MGAPLKPLRDDSALSLHKRVRNLVGRRAVEQAHHPPLSAVHLREAGGVGCRDLDDLLHCVVGGHGNLGSTIMKEPLHFDTFRGYGNLGNSSRREITFFFKFSIKNCILVVQHCYGNLGNRAKEFQL